MATVTVVTAPALCRKMAPMERARTEAVARGVAVPSATRSSVEADKGKM